MVVVYDILLLSSYHRDIEELEEMCGISVLSGPSGVDAPRATMPINVLRETREVIKPRLSSIGLLRLTYVRREAPEQQPSSRNVSPNHLLSLSSCLIA